jgi:hypothetical protein
MFPKSGRMILSYDDFFVFLEGPAYAGARLPRSRPGRRTPLLRIPTGQHRPRARRLAAAAGGGQEAARCGAEHLNTWTNYINVVAGTDMDFPVVNARKAA